MAITRQQWRQEVLDAKAAVDTTRDALTAALEAQAAARSAVEVARRAYEIAVQSFAAVRAARKERTGDDDVQV